MTQEAIEPKRVIGNTNYDMAIGRLIERTEAMSAQAENLAKSHAASTAVLHNLNITLTKMQGVLNGIIEERRQEKLVYDTKLAKLEQRMTSVEDWKSDVKFVQDLRTGWTKLLIWSLILGGVLLVSVARFGAATKFGD